MLSAIRSMQILFKFPHHLSTFSNVEICCASYSMLGEKALWVSQRDKQLGLEVRAWLGSRFCELLAAAPWLTRGSVGPAGVERSVCGTQGGGAGFGAGGRGLPSPQKPEARVQASQT